MRLKQVFGTASQLPAYQHYEGKPFVGSSHQWALETLATLPPQGALLDIGAASGFIAKHLSSQEPRLLTAVEPDRRSWAHLQELYPRLVGSLDELREDEFFEVIVILDVLEHVVDPEAFLAQAVAHLRPGGYLLISVPNIAHIAIRLMLLAGFFPKMSKGPLDRTHLHFFTKSTFEQLLHSVPNLEIIASRSSIPPLELLVRPSWGEHPVWHLFQKTHLRVAHWIPRLFAYQFLYLLRKVSGS